MGERCPLFKMRFNADIYTVQHGPLHTMDKCPLFGGSNSTVTTLLTLILMVQAVEKK